MNSRVILALDVEPSRAYEIAEEVKDLVMGFKIGWHLVLEEGVKAVERVSKLNYTIVDLKLADVPHVVKYVVSKLVEHGADGVIVHGFLGEKVLEELREVECDVYVIAAMTERTLYDYHFVEVAKVAKKLGFKGVVLPGNRTWIIRTVRGLLGDKLVILAPGVGAQGGDPREALRAGADAVIIGRSVVGDSRPRAKLLEVLSTLLAS